MQVRRKFRQALLARDLLSLISSIVFKGRNSLSANRSSSEEGKKKLFSSVSFPL